MLEIQEGERQKKWRKLELDSQNLKKELYGLSCMVKGVIAEKESHKRKTHEQVICIGFLHDFNNALFQIELNIKSEKEMELTIPMYFSVRTDINVTKSTNYDVDSTVSILNSIKEVTINIRNYALPSINSIAVDDLTVNFLYALKQFQNSFLEFASCR